MIRSFVVAACCVLFSLACSSPRELSSSGDSIRIKKDVPDYGSLNNWAAHPDKYDPSDSVPAPLQSSYLFDSTVDVFFIHPTTFIDVKSENWNADIEDAVLNDKTDRSTILFQASVFNQARVFSPRYRQANLKAYFTTDATNAEKAFNLAYEDVRDAFKYYMDHFNNGHPIIIASHSQGSTHAVRLLKEFFDGKPLQQKLIVAYVIGMNIPLTAFEQLKSCNDSIATGCFVGWRTFKRGHEPFLVAKYRDSYVTNPLTWTTTEEFADRKLNKGGVLRNFNRLYPHVTDAQIHESILWSDRPVFPGSFLYRASNYHIGDINLFYVNIRDNMQSRIRSYYNTHSH